MNALFLVASKQKLTPTDHDHVPMRTIGNVTNTPRSWSCRNILLPSHSSKTRGDTSTTASRLAVSTNPLANRDTMCVYFEAYLYEVLLERQVLRRMNTDTWMDRLSPVRAGHQSAEEEEAPRTPDEREGQRGCQSSGIGKCTLSVDLLAESSLRVKDSLFSHRASACPSSSEKPSAIIAGEGMPSAGCARNLLCRIAQEARQASTKRQQNAEQNT